jgi:hypothetical protein
VPSRRGKKPGDADPHDPERQDGSFAAAPDGLRWLAREIAEQALAHSLPDKVEAAYRRGDMLEKRRRLMEEWAAFCDTPNDK